MVKTSANRVDKVGIFMSKCNAVNIGVALGSVEFAIFFSAVYSLTSASTATSTQPIIVLFFMVLR